MFRQTQVLVGDGYIYEYLCVISNSHFILSLNLLEVINLRFPICSTQNAANLPVELWPQLVGPPFTVAKLVHITPVTMVYDTQITIVNDVYKPNYKLGGATLQVVPYHELGDFAPFLPLETAQERHGFSCVRLDGFFPIQPPREVDCKDLWVFWEFRPTIYLAQSYMDTLIL